MASDVLEVTVTDSHGQTVTSSFTLPVTAAGTSGPPVQPNTPSVVLVGENWLGIHYLPNPTVTLAATSYTAAGRSNPPVGCDTWCAYDLSGKQVGTGPIAATATSITVVTDGVWAGGAQAVPGYYTIVATDQGTPMATGNVAICPPTQMYVPAQYEGPTTYDPTYQGGNNLAAWLGTTSDRDYYSVPGNAQSNYGTAAAAAPNLLKLAAADPYFTGPQDPARPRSLWVASGSQANSPTQVPTAADWAAAAQVFAAANLPHPVVFELPTNEPENGGWNQAAIETYFNECVTAIQAVAPNVKLIGWDSGGLIAQSPLTALASFLASCGKSLAGFSNHMEDSGKNLADLVSLRAYYTAIRNQFAASGYPELTYWNTETGVEGGGYGCIQPRRDARQRTMIMFMAEQQGWPKEQQYNFEFFDHSGAGLPFFMVDPTGDNTYGNMRAGAYAIHVLSEALWGTTCPPAVLSFGSVGDSLYAGSHYSGSKQDVVVLATNGIPAGTVTLAVSVPGPVTRWDGMGVPTELTVTDGQIEVPVDDLLSYVFLPAGSTVSVVETDGGAVGFGSLPNLAASATCVNEAGTAVPVVHDGNWLALGNNIPGGSSPYIDNTLPATLTFTELGGKTGPETIHGFAFKTAGPAFETWGCAIREASITVDGTVVWSFTDPTCVSEPWFCGSASGSADFCTRTTFWQQPFGFCIKLPEPVQGSTVELTVTATGWAGEPDQAAAQNTTSHYNMNAPQQLRMAEFQIF